MKIKNFMKYFKEGVLKYFKISMKLNFHEIFKYFKVKFSLCIPRYKTKHNVTRSICHLLI